MDTTVGRFRNFYQLIMDTASRNQAFSRIIGWAFGQNTLTDSLIGPKSRGFRSCLQVNQCS